jgi:hypothetical protein
MILHYLVKQIYGLHAWNLTVICGVTTLAWTGDAVFFPTSYAAQRTRCPQFGRRKRSLSWMFMWTLYVVVYEGVHVETRDIFFLTQFGIYFTLVWSIEIYFWKWSCGAVTHHVTVNVMDKPQSATVSFFKFQYLLLFQYIIVLHKI